MTYDGEAERDKPSTMDHMMYELNEGRMFVAVCLHTHTFLFGTMVMNVGETKCEGPTPTDHVLSDSSEGGNDVLGVQHSSSPRHHTISTET